MVAGVNEEEENEGFVRGSPSHKQPTHMHVREERRGRDGEKERGEKERDLPGEEERRGVTPEVGGRRQWRPEVKLERAWGGVS